MYGRHLLSTLEASPLHMVTSQASHLAAQPKYRTILGLDSQVFIFLMILIGVALSIVLAIFIIYRRYRTRQDFNDNPEQFPHLPDLGWKETRTLQKLDLEKLLGAVQWEKDETSYQGPYYKVTFKENQSSGVFSTHELKNKGYFQIQILDPGVDVEIGFMHIEAKEKVKQGQAIGAAGVSLSTSGQVTADGQNVFNYNWKLNYGDVIGLGITKQHSKFNERRAWISKNGLLLNSPPMDEMDKWIATLEISAEQREKLNVDKQKEHTDEENKEGGEVDKAAEAKRVAFEQQQTRLKNQRISLKTFKDFQYYPVLYFPGKKEKGGQEKQKNWKPVTVNLNVGGQIFRMQEEAFRAGILD